MGCAEVDTQEGLFPGSNRHFVPGLVWNIGFLQPFYI